MRSEVCASALCVLVGSFEDCQFNTLEEAFFHWKFSILNIPSHRNQGNWQTHIPFGSKFGWWILISQLDRTSGGLLRVSVASAANGNVPCLLFVARVRWWRMTKFIPKQPRSCIFMILYQWYEWFPRSCGCFFFLMLSLMNFHWVVFFKTANHISNF